MGGNVNINNIASEFLPSKNLDGTAVTDRSVTVTSSVGALIVASLDDNTTHVNFDVQDSSVFYTLDGSDPVDGTNGHKIAKGGSAIWSKELASACRIIRGDATNARIHLSELQRR